MNQNVTVTPTPQTPVMADETVRLVIAVNKSLEPGRALNTACHLAAGITNLIDVIGRDQLKFLEFRDANGGLHPSISARSFIVLRASQGELRRLRDQFRAAQIPYVDFTSTMTGGTYVEQLAKTAETPGEQVEYFGIAAFGPRASLDPFTKKLSLWR
jgi:hypothetical protein